MNTPLAMIPEIVRECHVNIPDLGLRIGKTSLYWPKPAAVIRRHKKPTKRCELFMAFSRLGWANVIENPLGYRGNEMTRFITVLNRHCTGIKFRTLDKGELVLWHWTGFLFTIHQQRLRDANADFHGYSVYSFDPMEAF